MTGVSSEPAAEREAVRQSDMEQLRREVTVEGQVAGRLLNLSRNTTYKALRNGEIPSVRIGAQYRVPTAKLREMLGLTAPAHPAPIAA